MKKRKKEKQRVFGNFREVEERDKANKNEERKHA